MSDEKLKDSSRRNLIKGVGVVATIGVLAGATGRVVGKEVLTQDTQAAQGYRETPHVHDFYRTLRGTD
ncbi:transcriptional initiation protein Tat [Aeromonas salmonicida]|uniref:transcriptional initiation protein Tat n=1 Tax=Aeromonas salmonicida TaxID=645 RepID=UPI00259E80BA|nr:transcriptional initiation protein Tat [Aeromonas salmonicida]MDM5125868.1 transcriptional initiation protein Tat [Aeromonas salmonicida]